MLIALALAAALADTPDKAIVTGGVEMSCGVESARLTLWRKTPDGSSRTISADAKPGQTVLVDLEHWTAKASTVWTLSGLQYGFQSFGEQGSKPQSAVLDCSAKDAAPMKILKVEFVAG